MMVMCPWGGASLKYIREAKKCLLTTHEYNKCYRKLNKEQKELVHFNRTWCKQEVNRMKKGEPSAPYFVFLSGPGGTGKSHVIKMIHRDVKMFFTQFSQDSAYIDSTDPVILLTAFTGTAAFNIDGITLHSALCLPTTGTKNLSHEKRNVLEQRLSKLKVLVIDEISMISEQILNHVHERLCLAKKVLPSEANPFAGVSILAVGDFYQLRPVQGKALYMSSTVHHVSDLAPTLWSEFACVELTQIMRQKNDSMFANLLNDVRTQQPQKGSFVDQALYQRQVFVPDDHNMYPKNVMHAYARNIDAAKRNDVMLDMSPGELFVSVADDCVKDKSSNLFNVTLPDDPAKTGRLLKHLKLKRDARVMLTNNIDVSDGLTNGAMGTVREIICLNGKPDVILVEFDSSAVGCHARKTSKYCHGWPMCVPIGKQQTTFFLAHHKGAEAHRTQFPLFLSWAVTIHKLQGLTLDSLVVDMDKLKGRYNCGQAYVALSRVKQFENLHILHYDRTQIKPDPKVDSFMKDMRKKALPTIVPSISIANVDPTAGLTFCLLNVENLLSHIQDIECDPHINMCQMMFFTETHLKAEDLWPSHTIGQQTHNIFRHERKHVKGGGIAVCIDKTIESTQIAMCTNIEGVKLFLPSYNLTILCIYCKPSMSKEPLLKQLLCEVHSGTQKMMILGDFNDDACCTTSPFVVGLQQVGFRQCVKQPTTNYSTLLDHIYVQNISILPVYIADCYYSYHDVLLSTITNE